MEVNQLRISQHETLTRLQNLRLREGAGPKLHKPNRYNGKESVYSWTTQMQKYLRNTPDQLSLPIAISYFEEPAHEWWLEQERDGNALHLSSEYC